MTEVSFAKSFLSTLDNKNTKYQPDHQFDPATFGVRIPVGQPTSSNARMLTLQFTLPKLPTPQHPAPPKPSNDISTAPPPPPGAEKATTTTNTINITLKSNRNPAMTYSLPSTPPSTTIAALKQQVHTYLGGPSTVTSADKIKILHNKKPVPSSKQTVADIVDTDTKDLELGVMVMGGAPDPPPQESTAVKLRVPEAAGPGSENAAAEVETGVNPGEVTSTPMEDVHPTASHSESNPVQPGEVSGDDVLQSQEFWTDLEGFLAQRIRNQEEAARLRGVFESAWRSSSAAP